MPRVKEAILYREVGKRIKALRNNKKLKQEDLASQVGLSRASLVNIENGRHRPHLSTLYNLSAALRCSLIDLLPPLQQINEDLPEGFLKKINPNEKGVVAQALSQAKLGDK